MYQTPFDPIPQLKRDQQRFFWSRWLGTIIMSILFFGWLLGGLGLIIALVISIVSGRILWKYSMSQLEKQKHSQP
ncbi:hypothetical protein [Herpetosiphon llansteffanensis]|uniref:hypothetical protein n=1 Tax=Herpetosiphon llansteffanensis TaxID=2094568 RepID=UPI000D7C600F|nr:hypothetical protein [Herpetosiphon llansteffanensis]